MKTVRIIVESPDTGIVCRDITCASSRAISHMRALAMRYPLLTVRALGGRYTGCGSFVGRRVPAFPERD